jgi:hypothetical protein
VRRCKRHSSDRRRGVKLQLPLAPHGIAGSRSSLQVTSSHNSSSRGSRAWPPLICYVGGLVGLGRRRCCARPAVCYYSMTADSDGSVALRRRVLIGCSERCALDTTIAAKAGGPQLDSSVGTGTYIPRTASRPCRITEGIERAQRA